MQNIAELLRERTHRMNEIYNKMMEFSYMNREVEQTEVILAKLRQGKTADEIGKIPNFELSGVQWKTMKNGVDAMRVLLAHQNIEKAKKAAEFRQAAAKWPVSFTHLYSSMSNSERKIADMAMAKTNNEHESDNGTT